MSKLAELENFLLNENSTERKNYEDNILSGKSRRPEEEFITRHLGRDFWKELGYDDSELGFQEKAGDRGFVEIALTVDGKKIAVECKKPFGIIPNPSIVRTKISLLINEVVLTLVSTGASFNDSSITSIHVRRSSKNTSVISCRGAFCSNA